MGFNLDSRTLALATGMVALVLCAYMVHLQMTRRTYPGFKHWSLGALAIAAALPLMSLRDMLPDLLSVVAANVLLLCFTILVLRGLALFVGKKPGKPLDAVIFTLFLAAALVWTYLYPSINKRIISFSLVFSFYLLRCAWLIRRDVASLTGVGNQMLVGVFALTGLFFLVRSLVSAFFAQEPASLMAADPLQTATFLISLATVPVVLIGLVFLNIQRLEFELNKSQEEVKTLSGLLPICANCKRIRDDGGSWRQLEEYISDHSRATFSHGICPQCMKQLYPEPEEEKL